MEIHIKSQNIIKIKTNLKIDYQYFAKKSIKRNSLVYFCGLIGHQDVTEGLSLAYRENRQREGDSVIVIITSVTYSQKGNMVEGSN